MEMSFVITFRGYFQNASFESPRKLKANGIEWNTISWWS